MEHLGLILVAAMIAGLVAFSSMVGERKRREALSAMAGRLGLNFEPSADHAVHRSFGHSIFESGHSKKGYNSIYGDLILAGHPIQLRMGDYQYATGHGKSRRTHRISYATFQLPWVGTPDLLIRRENFGDKVAGGLGFDDIDFESEEFSRAYWVKSPDKRFAYDVVHPPMMEFLLGSRAQHVELVRDVCLILKGRSRWDPHTFEMAPSWFQAFLREWPEHLTHELRPRWKERA